MKNHLNTIEQRFVNSKDLDLKISAIHKGEHRLFNLDTLLSEFKNHLILNGWTKTKQDE